MKMVKLSIKTVALTLALLMVSINAAGAAQTTHSALSAFDQAHVLTDHELDAIEGEGAGTALLVGVAVGYVASKAIDRTPISKAVDKALDAISTAGYKAAKATKNAVKSVANHLGKTCSTYGACSVSH